MEVPVRFSILRIMTLLLIFIVTAAPVFAADKALPAGHQWFLFGHFLGMILLMGNVVVSALWMAQARKTADRGILFCASKSVARADWLFTVPGLLLILVPGIATVGPWGGFGRASWAELSLALFALIGLIWVMFLFRYQRRMLHLTREAAELRIGLSNEFSKVVRRWSMWNGIVTLILLASLYLMVFKPHLWGPVD